MRSLLFGVAVALMVTAPATALTEMSIEHGGVHDAAGNYVGGSNDYTPAAGETFEVTIVLTTDEPLTAWQCNFDDGGAGYQVAQVGWTASPPDNAPDANYGWFNWTTFLRANNAGWSASTAGSAVPIAVGPVNGLSTGDVAVDVDVNGAVSGWCFRMWVTAPDPMVPTVLTAGFKEAADMDTLDTLDDFVPLNLPEPASALFLLLGLPFLRRR